MFFTLLINIINFLIKGLGQFLQVVTSFFPSSPLHLIQNSQFNDLLSKINYFIPVYEFIVILQSYTVCVASYYLYSIYARWLKAIN